MQVDEQGRARGRAKSSEWAGGRRGGSLTHERREATGERESTPWMAIGSSGMQRTRQFRMVGPRRELPQWMPSADTAMSGSWPSSPIGCGHGTMLIPSYLHHVPLLPLHHHLVPREAPSLFVPQLQKKT